MEHTLCKKCQQSIREDYLIDGLCPVCYKKQQEDK